MIASMSIASSVTASSSSAQNVEADTWKDLEEIENQIGWSQDNSPASTCANNHGLIGGNAMVYDPPMVYDPYLPDGWSRKVVQRTMGASAGKYDVYIYSPDGKKIRSKTDLTTYFQRNNLDLKVEDFDFTVRGKGFTPTKKKTHTSKKTLHSLQSLAKNQNLYHAKRPKYKVTNSDSNCQGASIVRQKLVIKFKFPKPASKRTKRTHNSDSSQWHENLKNVSVTNEVQTISD